MHLETEADLAKLARRNPRALHRYEAARRNKRQAPALAELDDALRAAHLLLEGNLDAYRRRHGKLTAKPAKKGVATNAASNAAKRQRSYVAEADAAGVRAVAGDKGRKPRNGPKGPVKRTHAAALP